MENILKILEDNKIAIKWRECSPDYPPCSICGKIIAMMPIRLSNIENGKSKGEITFHIKCLANLGVDLHPIPNNEFLKEYNKHLIIYCKICPKLINCEFINKEEKRLLKKK